MKQYTSREFIKIVGPATALQYINIYNDSMKKKELKIPVDFNVGDKFWIMKDNRPVAKKIDRIDIIVDKDSICAFYISGDSFYNPNNIYHTKQELLNSL